MHRSCVEETLAIELGGEHNLEVLNVAPIEVYTDTNLTLKIWHRLKINVAHVEFHYECQGTSGRRGDPSHMQYMSLSSVRQACSAELSAGENNLARNL